MILLHHLKIKNFKQFEELEVVFPDSGSVLIEGNNEAGKSSLFEAVYFAFYGSALGDLNNPDLIRYNADAAEVTLEFSVDGRRFKVHRRMGGQQRAWVEIPQTDGSTEKVNGLRAVNETIQSELAMSGQAILNTCFVEQKQLGQLESLDKRQREATINELVNLTAFTRMEKTLGSERDDIRLVEVAKVRRDVARLDTEHEELVADGIRLTNIHAIVVLRNIHNRREAVAGEIASLKTKRGFLVQVIGLLERRDRIGTELAPALQLWEKATQAVTEAQDKVTSSENAAGDLLGLITTVHNLTGLRDRLRLMLDIEAEDHQHTTWVAQNEKALQRVAECEQALRKAKEQEQGLKSAVSAAEERDLLYAWVEAVRALKVAQNPAPDREAERLKELWRTATEKRMQKEQEAETAGTAAVHAEMQAGERERENNATIDRLLAESIAAPVPPAPSPTPSLPGPILAGTGLLTVVGGFLGKLTVAVILGLALLVVGAYLLLRRRPSASPAPPAPDNRRAGMQAEIDRLRKGIQAAREAANEGRAKANALLAQAESARREEANYKADYQDQIRHTDQSGRIPELGKRVQAAEEKLVAQRIQPFPADAKEAGEMAQARCEYLTGTGYAAEVTVLSLRGKLTEAETVREKAGDAERDALAAVVRQPARKYTPEQRQSCATVREDLRTGNIPDILPELEAVLQKKQDEKRIAEMEAGELEARTGRLREAEQEEAKRKQGFETRYRSVALSDDPSPAFVSVTDGRAAMESLGTSLTGQLENLLPKHSPAALTVQPFQEELRGVDTALGGLEQECAALLRKETEPRESLGLPTTEAQTLSELLPDLMEQHPEARRGTEAEWRDRKEANAARITANRGERKGKADGIKLGDEPLSLPTEQDALDRAEFQRDMHRAARQILTETRNLILSRVMPGTEAHVKRILPYLTDRRYRDIRWIADENRLEVLDTKKGDYVGKKVFSGGARDQISLALRLAFAMATLPDQKSVRPGWLFLDEPLSAFDEKRTQDLVSLLTGSGLLRKQFRQIFLVSHSKSFDPDRFDHRILLSDGKIVASTLST